MSNAIFLFIAGVFVGAAIFELSKKATSKRQFTHLLEGAVEKEADDLLLRTLANSEKRFASDL